MASFPSDLTPYLFLYCPRQGTEAASHSGGNFHGSYLASTSCPCGEASSQTLLFASMKMSVVLFANAPLFFLQYIIIWATIIPHPFVVVTCLPQSSRACGEGPCIDTGKQLSVCPGSDTPYGSCHIFRWYKLCLRLWAWSSSESACVVISCWSPDHFSHHKSSAWWLGKWGSVERKQKPSKPNVVVGLVWIWLQSFVVYNFRFHLLNILSFVVFLRGLFRVL